MTPHLGGLLAVLPDEALVVYDLVVLRLQAARDVVLYHGERGRRVVGQGLQDQQWGQQVVLVDV